MTLPITRVVLRPRLLRAAGPTRFGRWCLALVLAGLAFFLWPYFALWGLSLAVADPDPGALAAHIDITAVRGELRKKLNKDSPSTIGKLSDPFILWLERGIQRLGTRALDELVTVDWVRERLRAQAPPGQGFLPRVSYAFFDAPGGFAVRLEAPDQSPVHFRMTLQGYKWKVTAIYY
jgi:hypothetical protein